LLPQPADLISILICRRNYFRSSIHLEAGRHALSRLFRIHRGFQDYFTALDKKWKILPAQGDRGGRGADDGRFPAPRWPGWRTKRNRPGTPKRPASGVAGRGDAVVGGRVFSACVVVNKKGDILYIHGRTGKFLEPAAGQAHMNIVDMAREGLKFELAAANSQANGHEKDVAIPVCRSAPTAGSSWSISPSNGCASRRTCRAVAGRL